VEVVTITLDDRTVAWLRMYAARRSTSISRIIEEMLQQRMKEACGYREAMRRFLSKKPVRLSKAETSYPTRDEAHDRSGLRC